MSKVENLQTTNRANPFPCVSIALVVLAMFVLSWLAAKGVLRNNLQTLLIFAGLCLPIFIAELRNHHNKWAIIVFDAVPVITYAFGYLVLRGPVLTSSMVLWLAGFGVSICIWFAALVWACTRVGPRWVQRKGLSQGFDTQPEQKFVRGAQRRAALLRPYYAYDYGELPRSASAKSRNPGQGYPERRHHERQRRG